MITSLPLSWNYEENSPIRLNATGIFGGSWLNSATLGAESDFGKLFTSHPQFKSVTLIRGCSRNHAEHLCKFGFKKTLIGKEAVLNLSNDLTSNKSLFNLIKRGMKKGKVREIENLAEYKEKYSEFIANTTHNAEPQLKKLFQTEIGNNNRIFIFESFENKWLALISTSQNGAKKVHTELLLRRKDSQVGVMEKFIFKLSVIFKEEGYHYFSLGEVPFVHSETEGKYSKTIKFIGKRIKFAYNYEGLYNFKNKFSPEWKNLYLCTKPNLNFFTLFSLFISTNLFKLVLYKIKIFFV